MILNWHTTYNNTKHIPFIFFDPLNHVLLNFIHLFWCNLKLHHEPHQISKLAHMVIVFLLVKLILKEFWSNINKPEAPWFHSEKWLICCNVAESLYRADRYVLDCCSCLLSDFFPNVWFNFEVLSPRTQTFEVSGPEVNEIGYYILEKEVEPLPWHWVGKVNGSDIGHYRDTLDASLLLDLFLFSLVLAAWILDTMWIKSLCCWDGRAVGSHITLSALWSCGFLEGQKGT